jgi:drug/metabolite transporter (DMT)-like permease
LAESSNTASLQRGTLLAGAAWGLTAAMVAAGWQVFTRFGVRQTLTPHDLVALRYGIAGIILLPFLIRARKSHPPVSVGIVALLVIGAGFPYALATIYGLQYAPISHAGALQPGTLPFFTAILSVIFLGEALRRGQILGVLMIVAGSGLIGGIEILTGDGKQTIGHVLFISAAILWSVYTIAMRRGGVAPLRATAIVSVVSMVIYVPVYPFIFGSHIPDAPWGELLSQGVYQGLMSGILMYYAFNRSVALLGGARAAVFIGLVPVLATLLAIPTLGEIPGWSDIAGIIAVTVGAYWASRPAR